MAGARRLSGPPQCGHLGAARCSAVSDLEAIDDRTTGWRSLTTEVSSSPSAPSTVVVSRGRGTVCAPVQHAAIAHGLPVLQPATLRNAAIQEASARHAPDLIVVAAYGKLLPPEILDLPPHGCINVHASLLPRHRGAAPVQWAILAGDTATGVTIMQMNAEMDAGDIITQRQIPIDATDTTDLLTERLARLGASALEETIGSLKKATVRPQPQDPSRVTLAPRVNKSMGRIDWRSPAIVIERAVRAFQPWPSAHTTLDGNVLKVLHARVERAGGDTSAAPGGVVAGEGILVVATAEGNLAIERLQLAGHRALSADDFLRGHPVRRGTILGR